MPVTSPILLARLKEQISRHRLDSIADLIIENATECFSMEIAKAEDYLTIGNTRFGGDPDLPESFPWPSDGEPQDQDCRYCNFVAQINFAELPPLPGGALPRTGILYLFVRSMDGAANPVLLDAHYFDGKLAELRRTPSPDEEQLCDEYLINLVPQQIKAVPALSFPFYRKEFRTALESGHDFKWYDLDLAPEGGERIGQILGYANAGDIRLDLYRVVTLDQLGKRKLMFNDYWASMEEYEACVRDRMASGDKHLVKRYEAMRSGVTWLVSNREAISKNVAEWRLLFRLDSNTPMGLNINDADPFYVFIRDMDLESRRFKNLAGEVTQG